MKVDLKLYASFGSRLPPARARAAALAAETWTRAEAQLSDLVAQTRGALEVLRGDGLLLLLVETGDLGLDLLEIGRRTGREQAGDGDAQQGEKRAGSEAVLEQQPEKPERSRGVGADQQGRQAEMTCHRGGTADKPVGAPDQQDKAEDYCK